MGAAYGCAPLPISLFSSVIVIVTGAVVVAVYVGDDSIPLFLYLLHSGLSRVSQSTIYVDALTDLI